MIDSNSELRSTSPAFDAQLAVFDVDLDEPCRSFYVGGAGDVTVTTIKGTTLTIPGVTGIFQLGVSRFHTSGTTATGIVALY
jgi:hypothetical protein